MANVKSARGSHTRKESFFHSFLRLSKEGGIIQVELSQDMLAIFSKLKNYFLSYLGYYFNQGWSKPAYVGLIVTQRCNFRCCHCESWKSKSKELSLSEWKRIIKDLAGWLPKTRIDLTGGEPLLYKDILELIDFIKQNNLSICLHTNGSLIDRKMAFNLVQKGVEEIVISFYSLNPSIHDFLRGRKEAHFKALQAVQYLKQAQKELNKKVKIKLGVLLTKYNLPELLKLIKWAEENQLKIVPQPLSYKFYSQTYDPLWWRKSQLWPKEEEVKKVFYHLLEFNNPVIDAPKGFIKAIRSYYLNPKSALGLKCWVGQKSLVIDSQGEASFCYELDKLGKAGSVPLSIIWSSQKAKSLRFKTKNCPRYCRIIGCYFQPAFWEKIRRFFSYNKSPSLNILFKQRLKKAYWIAWLLQVIPFVRMVGLNGSMTTGKMRENSDIDFLIITKRGRIWTTRFLVTVLVHLSGQRRYAKKIAGRICLNRYQTDDFLDIQPHNLYHAQTFAPLVPLLDSNLYPRYQKANQWMERFNFKVKPAFFIKPVESKFLRKVQKLMEKILEGRIGEWLEKKLRGYQRRRILADPRTKESPKGRIRISEKELCFHPEAR